MLRNLQGPTNRGKALVSPEEGFGGLGFRAFRVWRFEFGGKGFGFGVYGLRVWGCGFGVQYRVGFSVYGTV